MRRSVVPLWARVTTWIGPLLECRPRVTDPNPVRRGSCSRTIALRPARRRHPGRPSGNSRLNEGLEVVRPLLGSPPRRRREILYGVTETASDGSFQGGDVIGRKESLGSPIPTNTTVPPGIEAVSAVSMERDDPTASMTASARNPSNRSDLAPGSRVSKPSCSQSRRRDSLGSLISTFSVPSRLNPIALACPIGPPPMTKHPAERRRRSPGEQREIQRQAAPPKPRGPRVPRAAR